MIPVLRSIDNLLNRFDELSKSHTNFLTDFDTNFPNIKNPLRDVTRSEEEQQKTAANILLVINENYDEKSSPETIGSFHQRIIKNRYHHRPPNYISNENLSFQYVPSRSSSVTTDSTLLSSRVSQITTVSSNASQSTIRPSNHESKIKLNTKTKPKVILQNSTTPRRFASSSVTRFTMETVNRLSKPKTYPQVFDEKPVVEQTHRRSKPHENIKKNTFESATTESMLSSGIKRTKAIFIKPSSKKLKIDNKVPKNASINNFTCPLVFQIPIPTVNFNFPIEQEHKLSRFAVFPKTILTGKRFKYYFD
ncbi:unnamed protein product [Adineta steineri]|uniref:Uncharacterized protein n=1 Tax=Adineta steineri TaxID=433720 RepID=A0A814LPN2_9BILA|nr:unnamed protein product [Adineta steineri]CAF3634858.1 unnamed protein product [Adineta steineri]